jgi:hypothetical protein
MHPSMRAVAIALGGVTSASSHNFYDFYVVYSASVLDSVLDIPNLRPNYARNPSSSFRRLA